MTIEAMLSTPAGSTFAAVQLAAQCCALTLWPCAYANGAALTLSRQHGITPSPGFFFMLSQKLRAQRAGAQRRRYRGAKRRAAAQGAAQRREAPPQAAERRAARKGHFCARNFQPIIDFKPNQDNKSVLTCQMRHTRDLWISHGTPMLSARLPSASSTLWRVGGTQ